MATPPARLLSTTLGALLLVGGLASASGCGDDSSAPRTGLAAEYPDASTGHLLEEPVEQGSGLALAPASTGVFGLVSVRNESDGPVELLGAEPVRVDEPIDVVDIVLVKDSPDVPISDRDIKLKNTRPVAGAVLPRSADVGDRWTIVLDLRVGPTDDAAVLAGIDVYYRADGKVLRQRWPVFVLLCSHADGTPQPMCDTYQGRGAEELNATELIG